MIPSFDFGGAIPIRYRGTQVPVSIVGILGRGDPGFAVFGARGVANEIASAIHTKGGKGAQAPVPDIYGSDLPDVAGDSVSAIADAEMTKIKRFANGLQNGKWKETDVFNVILVGHSWGADKAVDVAIELDKRLRQSKVPGLQDLYKNGKVQIHLITIDLIKRGTAEGMPDNDPRIAALKKSVTSWHNYYQTDDLKTEVNGVVLFGFPLRGKTYNGAINAPDKATPDPNDDVNHHALLPNQIFPEILKDLGL